MITCQGQSASSLMEKLQRCTMSTQVLDKPGLMDSPSWVYTLWRDPPKGSGASSLLCMCQSTGAQDLSFSVMPFSKIPCYGQQEHCHWTLKRETNWSWGQEGRTKMKHGCFVGNTGRFAQCKLVVWHSCPQLIALSSAQSHAGTLQDCAYQSSPGFIGPKHVLASNTVLSECSFPVRWDRQGFPSPSASGLDIKDRL